MDKYVSVEVLKNKNNRSTMKSEIKMKGLQEKTRAAAAPRKPKNGAVSSPLKAVEDMMKILFRSEEKSIGSEKKIDNLFSSPETERKGWYGLFVR